MEVLLILIGIVLGFVFFIKLSNKISVLDKSQESIFLLLQDIQKQLLQKNLHDNIFIPTEKEQEIIIEPIVDKIPEVDKEIISSDLKESNQYLPSENLTIADIADPIETEQSVLTEEETYFASNSNELHESWFARFRKNNPDFEKFIGENLINKIGILILVLGISFFVKYAIDKNWINESARVGIGILSGAILLFVAHKLRENYKAFSSIFVAGAIAVFYFTIGIAYHDYHLFTQPVAFAIMVVITAFSTFVALAYDRQELIILSIIGGFAVPFMVSDGSGNYNALFIYITILNVSMLVVSYYKRWFLVNFIAFIITSIVFNAWYVTTENITDKIYHAALIYGTIFYVLFSIVFLLNSIIRRNKLVSYEISAFVLNTALYFILGLNIFDNYHSSFKGLFTLTLGIYNLLYSIILFKKYKFDYNVIYILIGLALSFATITIPIQFNGNFITLLWMCEAVLMYWFAKKSGLKGFAFIGIIVQFLSIVSMLLDWELYSSSLTIHPIFLNKLFITGSMLIASLIITYKLFSNYDFSLIRYNIKVINNNLYKRIVLALAIILSYLVPILDISYFADKTYTNIGKFWTFIYLFHIVYTSVIAYLGLQKNGIIRNFSRLIVILNTLLYIIVAYKIPLVERLDSFSSNEHPVPIGFIFHFVSVAFLIFQNIILVKNVIKDEKLATLAQKILPWLIAFVVVYIASAEANILLMSNAKSEISYYDLKNFCIKVIFPILWGLVSFCFLISGIKRKNRTNRIVALSLLGITILKLFIFDIRGVSETGKIIAFILLGVLILIISFIYQRIKKMVTEDDKKDEQ